MGVLKGLAEGALNLVYPPKCIYCGSAGGVDASSGLCALCLSAEETFGDDELLCERCGYPLESAADRAERGGCRHCEHVAYRFTYAASASRYEGRVREMIRRYKYGAMLQVAGHFAELLSRAYGRSAFFGKAGTVVPVPPAGARRRTRGYDPVGIFAEKFAEAEGMEYRPEAIGRAKDTRPLAGLSAGERRAETAGAFAGAAGSVEEGAGVILVDDIITTGATMDDGARALKQAGAGRVYALSVARDVL
ncbi:MAG: ComF family protein [Planctomycetes bacterium]|nr:ComF family protein [Planctomycetota bacterium]